MSATVPPTPPSLPAATLATALSTARGAVVSVPNTVTLTQGQSLNAQVVSSNSGQILLSSSLGNLTVRSNATLPVGTSVLLQVQSLGQTPQVTLQYHQGTGTPSGHPPNLSAAQNNAPQASGQSTAPVVTQLTEGSVHPASVTRVLLPSAATPAAPSAGALPGLPSSAPTSLAATGFTTPAGAHTGAATAQTALTAGTNLTIRILAVAPPGNALPNVPAVVPQPGAFVFAASVTGHQAGSGPVVAGPTAEFVLQNTHPLPNGSQLLLEATNFRAPAAADARAALSFLGGRWEALHDALTALHQIDPAVVRQVIETTMPTPGPRMTGTMLFFLSVLFSGDVRRFVGTETMRQLGRAGGGAADRLSSEFGQLRRTATDASGQDWRLFHVPFLTEEGLEELRFMLRKGEEDGADSDSEAGTRFMIEVTMSRLGPFQFDGLTRNKHLDLVIRTQQELPPDVQETIRAIFGNTISALGFSGTITLRIVSKFDISPIEQIDAGHKDLTV